MCSSGCAAVEDPRGLDEGQNTLSLERWSFCSQAGLWGEAESIGPHAAVAAGQWSVETGHEAKGRKGVSNHSAVNTNPDISSCKMELCSSSLCVDALQSVSGVAEDSVQEGSLCHLLLHIICRSFL